MGNSSYYYVPLPVKIAEIVDKAVAADKYPVGNYRSRAHYILEAVKNQLRKEGFLDGGDEK